MAVVMLQQACNIHCIAQMMTCEIHSILVEDMVIVSLNVSHCWLQYWNDPADSIQEREGTLLPLWRFTAVSAQGRHVTALAWNPAYPGRYPHVHPRALLFWNRRCHAHEACCHTSLVGTISMPEHDGQQDHLLTELVLLRRSVRSRVWQL